MPGRFRRQARVGAVAAAVSLLTAIPLGTVGPLSANASSPTRVPLRGSTFPWAATEHTVGEVPPTRPVSVRVYLAARDQRALDATVAAVSAPGNPSYRHFLTQDQYQTRFGPTAAQVAAVRTWLRASGMRVTGLAPDNRYVTHRDPPPRPRGRSALRCAPTRVAGSR